MGGVRLAQQLRQHPRRRRRVDGPTVTPACSAVRSARRVLRLYAAAGSPGPRSTTQVRGDPTSTPASSSSSTCAGVGERRSTRSATAPRRPAQPPAARPRPPAGGGRRRPDPGTGRASGPAPGRARAAPAASGTRPTASPRPRPPAAPAASPAGPRTPSGRPPRGRPWPRPSARARGPSRAGVRRDQRTRASPVPTSSTPTTLPVDHPIADGNQSACPAPASSTPDVHGTAARTQRASRGGGPTTCASRAFSRAAHAGRMRIAQVANFVGPNSGGVKTVLDALGRGYVAAGHERLLVVPGRSTRWRSRPPGPSCVSGRRRWAAATAGRRPVADHGGARGVRPDVGRAVGQVEPVPGGALGAARRAPPACCCRTSVSTRC